MREDSASTVETLFATATPATCPSDPVLKQRHLRALAFAALATGTAGQPRRGRPEFVAVIDIHAAPGTAPSTSPGTSSGTGGSNDLPVVEFPIPIEVPARVLADLIDTAEVSTVVVRNGIVLHARGELNLGRSTRLANRAQRRALRGLYRDCAVPGCTVSYNRCKLHHIIWWRNGGNTNLDNLTHSKYDPRVSIEMGTQQNDATDACESSWSGISTLEDWFPQAEDDRETVHQKWGSNRAEVRCVARSPRDACRLRRR